MNYRKTSGSLDLINYYESKKLGIVGTVYMVVLPPLYLTHAINEEIVIGNLFIHCDLIGSSNRLTETLPQIY